MDIPFAAIVTPESLVFTLPSGHTHTVVVSDSRFLRVKELVKKIGHELRSDPDGRAVLSLIEHLVSLTDTAQTIVRSGGSDVEVRDGVVYYRGEAIHSVLTDRILWGLSEGYDMSPYLTFLTNLKQNPSMRSVEQLFTFVERHKMGITQDGYILAYKKVRGDFLDIYTGTMDNSPGKVVEMPRNRVDDDPGRTCSKGLHCCAQSYLSQFGMGGGREVRIVIVKVHPKDVVSVPVDYDGAKLRACEYLVLSEYQGSDTEDLLASKPIFSAGDFTDSEDEAESTLSDDHPADEWRGYHFDEDDIVTCVAGASCSMGGLQLGKSYRVASATMDNMLRVTEDGDWYPADWFIPADGDSLDAFLESEELLETFGNPAGPMPEAVDDDVQNSEEIAAVDPLKAAVWSDAGTLAQAALRATLRPSITLNEGRFEVDPVTGVWLRTV